MRSQVPIVEPGALSLDDLQRLLDRADRYGASLEFSTTIDGTSFRGRTPEELASEGARRGFREAVSDNLVILYSSPYITSPITDKIEYGGFGSIHLSAGESFYIPSHGSGNGVDYAVQDGAKYVEENAGDFALTFLTDARIDLKRKREEEAEQASWVGLSDRPTRGPSISFAYDPRPAMEKIHAQLVEVVKETEPQPSKWSKVLKFIGHHAVTGTWLVVLGVVIGLVLHLVFHIG